MNITSFTAFYDYMVMIIFVPLPDKNFIFFTAKSPPSTKASGPQQHKPLNH